MQSRGGRKSVPALYYGTWTKTLVEHETLCIYCSDLADSLEHPLPAAFGEFTGAPQLRDRICRECNNVHLGVLDEQLVRCGPEGFLRQYHRVWGRPGHDSVNSFYRGSAGGHRLEMKGWDSQLGIEVLLECKDGHCTQARQLIFIEDSGLTHHLPIREDASPEQLLAEFRRLRVKEPFDTRFLYSPEEADWVEQLIKKTWPAAFSVEGKPPALSYQGVAIRSSLTDRYFRAIAKIGFHYFLTQFSDYTGHEPMFSTVRRFIREGGGGVRRANEFIGMRERPILGELLDAGARPDGWWAHVVCTELKANECLAHVQMFLSKDYPAPIYTIKLAGGSPVTRSQGAGHMYTYYSDGRRGKYSGEAVSLETRTVPGAAPPLKPVVAEE